MTFDRQGPQNTEATLKLAMEAARGGGNPQDRSGVLLRGDRPEAGRAGA